jgi:micrococcal nuclease
MMPQMQRLVPKFALFILLVLAAAINNLTTKAFGVHNHYNFSINRGVVEVVYDGDTIKVRFEDGTEKKVRLIGIDSPEFEDERDDIRFLASISKRFSFDHLYRKKVRLSFDWEREDKYGRLLAYVWLDKDILFNEFILKEGFASVFLKFPFREDYRQRFVQAERTAREQERGLWQKEPLPAVSSSEAVKNTGRYISVNFKCTDVQSRGRFVFLRSPDDFSALIPRNSVSLFSDLQSLEGKWLSAKGYLEDYQGKPQIIVFFPLQISPGHEVDKVPISKKVPGTFFLYGAKRCLAPFWVDRTFYKVF